MFFFYIQYLLFFAISAFFPQFVLETFRKIVYNGSVYPQFSGCVKKPLGQMRGNDNHECIQQEEAPQCRAG